MAILQRRILNDHYRAVVNRNNRLKKLIELHAPQVIVDNESRELQRVIDALFANLQLPEAKIVRGDQGRPLKDILDILFGRVQRQENAFIGVAWHA